MQTHPKEYWVNVYPGYSVGDKHSSRLIAERSDGGTSIYRIHVKMKEVNSGIGKFKPKYEWLQPAEHYSKLFDVM